MNHTNVVLWRPALDYCGTIMAKSICSYRFCVAFCTKCSASVVVVLIHVVSRWLWRVIRRIWNKSFNSSAVGKCEHVLVRWNHSIILIVQTDCYKRRDSLHILMFLPTKAFKTYSMRIVVFQYTIETWKKIIYKYWTSRLRKTQNVPLPIRKARLQIWWSHIELSLLGVLIQQSTELIVHHNRCT